MRYPLFDRALQPLDTGIRRVTISYVYPEETRKRWGGECIVSVTRAWRNVDAFVAYADIWSDNDDPYRQTWKTVLFAGTEEQAKKFMAAYKPPFQEIYRDEREVRYIDPDVEKAYIDVLIPRCDDGEALAKELNSAYRMKNIGRGGC